MSDSVTVEPEQRALAEKRARLVVDALTRLGLDAYTPGERDLALGLEFLKKLLRNGKGGKP